jgi:16S rRNA (adenine1518-N6/adenine1519-N6)-dimethyltransferase
MKFFAKKSLGQNFLASPQAVADIARAAEIVSEETIIEIGPGTGILTEALLSGGARVTAYEKDDRLQGVLKAKFAKEIREGRFTLIHADILETPQTDFHAPYKLVANIPYYITGAVLRMFLEAGEKPSMMVLMVQKEVVDRMIAHDGKESMLSISVKAYGTPIMIRKVGRGSFRPEPTVDSAVIRIEKINNPFSSRDEEKRFFDIMRAGFAQKRKKLSRNLESVAKKEVIDTAFKTLSLGENTRAEDVTPSLWIELAKRLS